MPEKSPRQPRKPFQSAGKRDKQPIRRSGADKPERKEFRKSRPSSEKPVPAREKKPVFRKSRPVDGESRPEREEKPAYRKVKTSRGQARTEKPGRPGVRKGRANEDKPGVRKPGRPVVRKDKFREGDEERPVRKTFSKGRPSTGQKKYPMRRGVRFKAGYTDDGIRLNKYVANAGICSRREADQLIKAGVISVNGAVVTELGTKVKPGEKVQYGDQTLSNETKRYLLLNKQKGYVTTTKDPHAKNTVMELIAGACKERIYPVGRLDRNTTGLLLFTNDGELAKKLMHPSSRIMKMYHVVLDQALKKGDMMKVASGVEIEEGFVKVDSIAYVEDAADRKEVGLEIHSGQNRVVRRIFESLGYKVTKLDRVMFAGLTKKNLPRGKWRFLSEREVINLKMLR